jgi:SAM-dependent methyltransferase
MRRMDPFVPSPGWFRKHFNEDYRTIYAGRNQAEADEEAASIVRTLDIRPRERVLDLCCGFGRHVVALRKLGIHAIGADLSLTLLRQAARGRPPHLVAADMRALPFGGGAPGFAVVVNFFTSFGYFAEDSENEAALREIARVLEAGGRFSLDLMNARPTIRSLVPLTVREAGPYEVREERRHDAARGRIEKRITLICQESGVSREYHESVRIFTRGEITASLAGAGLTVERVLGGFDGLPHDEGSPRMIVIGRK